VYAHFAAPILTAITAHQPVPFAAMPPHRQSALIRAFYDRFILHIDAIDNGVSPCGTAPVLYDVPTSLSARIARLNLPWNVNCTFTTAEQRAAAENERFRAAMQLATRECIEVLADLLDVHWAAEELVVACVLRPRPEEDAAVVVLDQYLAGWKDVLLDMPEAAGVLYVVYPDVAGGWRVQAVPDAKTGFGMRKPLPRAWRGKRDAELDAVCGLNGSVFVHAGGFIGGHRTQEGALAMARMAVREPTLP
jgi:uncharacterized UPF0160 family protein